jgi:hypothetical protein
LWIATVNPFRAKFRARFLPITARPVTPISAVPGAVVFAAMREVLLVVDGRTARADPCAGARDGCGDVRWECGVSLAA